MRLEGPRFKVQKALYQELVERKYPDDLAETFIRRSQKYFHHYARGLVAADLEPAKDFICKLPVAVAQQCIRSWCNGWITSERLHEAEPVPPMCGCSHERDTWQHYMTCGYIWYIAALIDRQPLCQSPLERLGLVSPSFSSVLRLIAVCNAYHSIRKCHQHSVIHAISTGNLKIVYGLWAQLIFQHGQRILARPDLGRYRKQTPLYAASPRALSILRTLPLMKV